MSAAARSRTTGRARRGAAPTRSPQRPQPRGDRTREAILDEAVACILDEGFAAASAKHVAERAGVTWGVIQYHFGDRNGLLAAVVQSGFEDLTAAVADVSVPDGSPRARVRAVVDAAWAAFSTPRSRASLEILVATRAERDPAYDLELADMARAMHRLGAVLVADDPRRVRRGRAVGEVLWAALRGLALAQMVVRRPLDTISERATLTDLLTTYVTRSTNSPS